jgi:cell division protease FtsH
VTSNPVSTATIASTGSVTGKLKDGTAYTSRIPTALNDSGLSPLLVAHKVQVTGTNPSSASALSVIVSLLLLFVGVFVWLGRRARKQLGGGGLGGIMGIGKSRAKVYDEERPTTRFSDIAGYEGSKAEIAEVEPAPPPFELVDPFDRAPYLLGTSRESKFRRVVIT